MRKGRREEKWEGCDSVENKRNENYVCCGTVVSEEGVREERAREDGTKVEEPMEEEAKKGGEEKEPKEGGEEKEVKERGLKEKVKDPEEGKVEEGGEANTDPKTED